MVFLGYILLSWFRKPLENISMIILGQDKSPARPSDIFLTDVNKILNKHVKLNLTMRLK